MGLFTSEKHYNSLTNYYKHKYQNKIAKITLNANFSCPNKDGKTAFGGCSYCCQSEYNSTPLKKQFWDRVLIMEKKWPNALYIPYLNSNSNTYASLENLKKVYEEILSFSPKIVGLAIATRCDCLEDDKIAYLKELNKRIPIQIELGLQTIHEKTAKLINRGHTLGEFTNIVNKLLKANIEVVVHVINGLPGETEEMMIDTAKYLNTLGIHGIKIHNLLILKNTKMYDDYLLNPFKILSLEEYVNITCQQITHLNKDIIIHRLSADAEGNNLFLPLWSQKKLVVMNEIDKRLRKLNIYQGSMAKAHIKEKTSDFDFDLDK